MIFIWLAAFIVLLIIEAATVGLAAIFFAAGAMVALLSAALGAPLWLQIVWFIVVSAVSMYFARPLAIKYVNTKRLPTNADRTLGMIGIVVEDIDNIAGTGAVSVGGKTWTARSLTGEVIAKDARVRGKSIEGVKLIVERADATDRETAGPGALQNK